MPFTRAIAIVFGFQLVTAVVAAMLRDSTALFYVLAAVCSGWIAGLLVNFHIYEKAAGLPRLVNRQRRRF